jgi:exopolysaccharide production protein ExoQ
VADGLQSDQRSTTASVVQRPADAESVTNWVTDSGYALLLAGVFWTTFVVNAPDNLDGFAHPLAGVYDPNPLTRAFKLFAIAASCLMIARRPLLAWDFGRNLNPGLVAFMLLAPLSTMWSIAPSATVARCTSLATLMLSCFALGLASWHPRRFQQVATPPLMLIMAGSLALGAVALDLVTERGGTISLAGAWHGLTHGKNEFGMLASTAMILCAHAWMSREGRRTWSIFGAAVALACLILSKSNTSMFATAVAVAVMLLLLRPSVTRHWYAAIVVMTTGLLFAYAIIVQRLIPGLDFLLAPVASLTGKGMDFSGRTPIWDVIKDHIALNPFAGCGYGAYWIGPLPESPSYVFVGLMWFYPTEAHNGYLEVLNDLGLAGFACLLVFLVAYTRQSLQLMRTDRNQATLFLALLFQELVLNMSESMWFSSTNTFAILALGSVMLSRAQFDARLRGLLR